MYIADLHIHSHYSRATSKDCTLEYLDLWARRKGIDILGTGDFTHPAWREELKEKLIPAEEGLYLLKEEYRMDKDYMVESKVPRFVISGEISSIYKKNGKVRKVHSLFLLPGLEEAELLSKKLETIGNLHSDGNHYDGHRKCNLCLSPSEAEQYSGKCPVCGRKLTTGVSHRIEQLADRSQGFVCFGGKPFESLVPLPEVIAASIGYTAASGKVQNQYESMLRNLGSELQILRELPLEDINHVSGYMISEGIRRLREGKVDRSPGYDGKYGTIKLFEEGEINKRSR